MEIKFDKTSDVSGRLTVSVLEADYKENVLKKLKEYGRNHAIPGFRKGHVPTAELNRRFGRMVTSDVINHDVYEAVLNYIHENKLEVLGEPVPTEIIEIDPKKQTDYTFTFDVALAPALDIKLDKSVKVPFYTIEVTDEMVENQSEAFRKRFGAQVPGEEFEEDALVKGGIMELDADGKVKESDDAIQVVNGILMPLHFADKDEAAKFNGKKVGDKVVFNPAKACGTNITELASMLNIDKAKAENVTADFEMAISEFIVVRKAELGEDLYKNVFGPDKVHNEEEWKAAVKSLIERDLAPNSMQLFERDFTDKMMAEYGEKMELPVEILKKWLVIRNEGLTEENIDEEFKKMEPGLRWQLIRDVMIAQTGVKVTDEDYNAFATQLARQQFAQYGMTNIDDETLAEYGKRILEDRNSRNRIAESVLQQKLMNAVRQLIDAEPKSVSLDEFRTLAQGEAAE